VNVLVAFALVAGVAAWMFCLHVDACALAREVELDEIWEDGEW
jgi:hypothetical protein